MVGHPQQKVGKGNELLGRVLVKSKKPRQRGLGRTAPSCWRIGITFILFLFTELEICSETDSTNECSDFKSELDDELEGDPNQQRLSSAVVPSSVGSGSTGAGSSQSAVSASGQDRVPAGQGAPRKSSGGGRKNTRVVFV